MIQDGQSFGSGVTLALDLVDYTEKQSQLGAKQKSVVHLCQSEKNGMPKPWYSYAPTHLTLVAR